MIWKRRELATAAYAETSFTDVVSISIYIERSLHITDLATYIQSKEREVYI